MHPAAKWEEYCALANAERARKNVTRIIDELHVAAGLKDAAFVSGMSVHSLKAKP